MQRLNCREQDRTTWADAGFDGPPVMWRRARSALRRSSRFSASKWRVLLGQTIARCVMQRKQSERAWGQHRAEAAQLMQSGQEDRVDEQVILCLREKARLAAFIVVQDYCEQVIDKLPLIEQEESKECPEEVREAVASLLFTASMCKDFVELEKMKLLFEAKFGSPFVASVIDNLRGVGSQIIELLSNQTPSWPVRAKYMAEIAKEFDIKWGPTRDH
ncbi:hypothetical protein GOP47_0022851 [Adiantum capillus-veneris]|uniref:Uncharacterized protein n=1 Tax=Adiantum capillus-veneris TaxID=13818 RepID=A0A9D4U6L5_ADICA|nr:hypothetical protein GOP47_0022851 [Adiantum capillus-veneris]